MDPGRVADAFAGAAERIRTGEARDELAYEIRWTR